MIFMCVVYIFHQKVRPIVIIMGNITLIFWKKVYSWVINHNSVTVESISSFLSGFVFYKGKIFFLASTPLAKGRVKCVSFLGQGFHILGQFDDLDNV